MKKTVYFNGTLMAEKKATVSVFDRGLNYGDGLFETMKSVNGKVEFLRQHLSRLKRGATFLGFPAAALRPLMLDIKEGAIEELIKANGLTKKQAYLRVTVTRGEDHDGHLPKRTAPTVIMVAKAIDTDTINGFRAKGITAVALTGRGPAIPGVKSLNYLPSVLGKAEAARKGAVEGLFVSKDGLVLEGTSSNIFVVSERTVLTPPVSTDQAEGVLPGVMRSAVIRLLARNKVAVKLAPVSLRCLRASAEAFLTNSIWGAVPLTALDGKKLGDGLPGPVLRLVQRKV